MKNELPTITPLSKEEITKTQILNFQEVKKTALQEIKSSRTKFVTSFLFILGALFIISGFLYTPVYNLLNKQKEEEKVQQAIELRKSNGPITCTIKAHNEKEGTNKELTYKININDKTNTIKNYTKNLVITPSTKSDLSKTSIAESKQKYTTLQDQKVNGYSILITEQSNTLEVLVTINLEAISLSTFPDVLKEDPTTTIEYKVTDKKKDIINDLKNKGYKCN